MFQLQLMYCNEWPGMSSLSGLLQLAAKRKIKSWTQRTTMISLNCHQQQQWNHPPASFCSPIFFCSRQIPLKHSLLEKVVLQSHQQQGRLSSLKVTRRTNKPFKSLWKLLKSSAQHRQKLELLGTLPKKWKIASFLLVARGKLGQFSLFEDHAVSSKFLCSLLLYSLSSVPTDAIRFPLKWRRRTMIGAFL